MAMNDLNRLMRLCALTRSEPSPELVFSTMPNFTDLVDAIPFMEWSNADNLIDDLK